MSECSFCGKELKPATGIQYVKTDGKVLFFCKHKCEMNMFKLKRNPARQRWTSKFHENKAEKKKVSKK